MIAISINGLTKKYKERIAVDDLSLDINEGELFALLGFNGAGKTTTIKLLTGLLKPTSGDAYIFKKSIVNEINDIKPILNISPQESAVAPNLSVFENLVLIAEIYGFKKEEAINKAYRGKDVPTDVISFAFLDHIETEITIKGDVPRLLGEIMISYETAKRQAKAYAHSLQREMKFLFTHGILHLLGYNHETEEQEKIMFALQEQILDQEKKR